MWAGPEKVLLREGTMMVAVIAVAPNPNLGFRYNSPARLGSEGGPWGGGRGASWTHKDPLAGIQSERFYNTSSTSSLHHAGAQLSSDDARAHASSLEVGMASGFRHELHLSWRSKTARRQTHPAVNGMRE